MKQIKLLTTEEAAELLRIPAATLTTYRSRVPRDMKPIPYVKIGKRVLYNEEDLRQWLEGQSRS